MEDKRFFELDALRGFAALFVMFFHFTEGKTNLHFFNLGVTAVDLFFIISGFVIFMSINKVSSGKEFIINRISRLYPTYWTCVTITYLVMLFLVKANFHFTHVNIPGFKEYLANMTMFQYYLKVPNLDSPYWTMIIEMLFYLFILLLFQLKLLKRITEIGCAINIIIILNYLLVVNKSVTNFTIYFPLLNHFALFFAGITFYKITHHLQSKLYGYCVILFCIATQIIIFKSTGSDPAHIILVQYLFALIIYTILFTLFINEKLKFIVSRPTIFLGNISFALYLIHSFIFRGLIGYLVTRFHLNFWVTTIFIATPLVILMAFFITNYIEKPYGKKMKNYLNNFLKPSMSPSINK